MKPGRIADHLALCKGFHHAPSLWATEGSITGGLGQLPAEWQARYRADAGPGKFFISYTVMSYETPIAWVVLDENGLAEAVRIPRVDYSTTTARAQHSCRLHLPHAERHTSDPEA